MSEVIKELVVLAVGEKFECSLAGSHPCEFSEHLTYTRKRN